MATQKVLAFDLYGTLLSTESIAKKLEAHFPAKAQSIATLWRRYQLEYTWRLNSMGIDLKQICPATVNISQEYTRRSPRLPATPSDMHSQSTTSTTPSATTRSPP